MKRRRGPNPIQKGCCSWRPCRRWTPQRRGWAEDASRSRTHRKLPEIRGKARRQDNGPARKRLAGSRAGDPYLVRGDVRLWPAWKRYAARSRAWKQRRQKRPNRLKAVYAFEFTSFQRIWF